MARPPKSRPLSFYEVLTQAVNELSDTGYVDPGRVAYWVEELRRAAERDMISPAMLARTVEREFRGIYKRQIEDGLILRRHEGVPKFTIERVKPKLRAELDRRIVAAADLIVLTRENAIRDTTQRFTGWASSIPPGGTEATKKRETKFEVRKALADLPFRERRVAIDQGHKFIGNLSDIIATDGGALAGRWHSHWRQLNYKYRKEHKERDLVVYAIRDNWALVKGLMKLGGHKCTDQITAPGEEVYCRCYLEYLYHLRDLPPEMITELGKQEIKRTSDLVRSMMG